VVAAITEPAAFLITAGATAAACLTVTSLSAASHQAIYAGLWHRCLIVEEELMQEQQPRFWWPWQQQRVALYEVVTAITEPAAFLITAGVTAAACLTVTSFRAPSHHLHEVIEVDLTITVFVNFSNQISH